MKQSHLTVKLIFCCLGVVFGVLISILVKKCGYFVVDDKLDLVAIISIFANILLVLYVAYIIDKRKEMDKLEKDIYITRLNDYYRGIYSKINKLIENDPIDYGKAAAASKVMRMRLLSLIKYGIDNNLISATCKHTDEIKETTTDIWQLLTDDGTQTIEIKISEIERKLIDAENEIFSLISHVNHQNIQS